MINRLLLSLVILISMSGLGSAQLAINPCCTTSPFVALESLQTDWQRTSSSQPLAMQPLSYSTCVRNCRRSGNSQNVCGDCCANGSCPPYPIGPAGTINAPMVLQPMSYVNTSSCQPLAMQPLSYSTCVRNCRRSGNSQNVCGDCCANGSCPPYPIGMGFRQVQYQMEPTIRLQSSTRFRLLRRLFGN